MFRLFSQITINGTTFQGVNNLEIESSWQNLTDTCTIQLANNFKRNGRNITVGEDGFFKRGDQVSVSFGYFPDLVLEFEGYIRKIFVDNLITIECEDASFLLKQNTVTFSDREVTAQSLLDEILSTGTSTDGANEVSLFHETVDAELGKFRVTRVTPAQVLEELRKKYGLVSYIRSGVLRVGLAYYLDEAVRHNFSLEDNVIENNLEFIDVNELKPAVLGLNTKDDNEVIEKWAYYEVDKTEPTIADEKPDGYAQTDEIHIKEEIGVKSLESQIVNILNNRISTGIRGSFTTFIEPSVKHGDKVNLISRKFPEKEGVYLVKKVVKNFGLSGGRQEITLDRKVLD